MKRMGYFLSVEDDGREVLTAEHIAVEFGHPDGPRYYFTEPGSDELLHVDDYTASNEVFVGVWWEGDMPTVTAIRDASLRLHRKCPDAIAQSQAAAEHARLYVA